MGRAVTRFTFERGAGRAALRLIAAAGLAAALTTQASAQSAPPGADPWPRPVALPDARLSIYQPQLESWKGNTASFRAAVGVTAAGTGEPSYGVVWATARTEVDPIRRAVTLQDVRITRGDFPTLPDQGAGLTAELQRALPDMQRTISLDRMEAGLAASAGASAEPVAVENRPPEIIVSYVPAVLVPIDGKPVLRPVPDAPYERVVNALAVILRPRDGGSYYLHAYDGWQSAGALDGAWQRVDHRCRSSTGSPSRLPPTSRWIC